jgi:hypothetical protein
MYSCISKNIFKQHNKVELAALLQSLERNYHRGMRRIEWKAIARDMSSLLGISSPGAETPYTTLKLRISYATAVHWLRQITYVY